MPSKRPQSAPQRRFLLLTFRIIAILGILTAAMVPVALVVNWWDREHPLGPGTLLLLAPLIYVVWLVTLMVLFRLALAPAKYFYPKPRFLEVTWSPGSMMAMAAIGLGYHVETLLSAFPLVPLMATMPGVRRLYWNAYSRPPKAGRNLVCYGRMIDPDLIEIGNDVIIGAGSSLTAHAFVTRNHSFSYLSGPIRIGNRVTIGAAATVGMYSVIEDDVIIEAKTSIGRARRIKQGEIWGGTPARFIRMAEGFEHLEAEREQPDQGDDVADPVPPDATPIR